MHVSFSYEGIVIASYTLKYSYYVHIIRDLYNY